MLRIAVALILLAGASVARAEKCVDLIAGQHIDSGEDKACRI